VLIASGSCFQEHYEEEVTTTEKGQIDNNVHREIISVTSESLLFGTISARLYGFDMIPIVQTIENNWWIILVAMLLMYGISWLAETI